MLLLLFFVQAFVQGTAANRVKYTSMALCGEERNDRGDEFDKENLEKSKQSPTRYEIGKETWQKWL
jgi:hypothetical protein